MKLIKKIALEVLFGCIAAIIGAIFIGILAGCGLNITDYWQGYTVCWFTWLGVSITDSIITVYGKK